MKILQVNKFFYPKAGADKYFLELSAELTKNGHEVRFFAMADSHNLPCPDAAYFVSNISYDGGGLKNDWRALARMLYSLEAKRKFTALLQDFRPDIIHVHNIYHQLSPSIIDAARAAKIPVVMHLHDYKLICPNYKLFSQGQVCDRCRPDKYYNCVRYKCVDNSVLKSSGAALEMYLHHKILKIYERGVDLFIAPSRFMKSTIVSFGWPADKIHYLPNFFSPDFVSRANSINNPSDPYLLYFGRLAEEKGIAILLQAAKITGERVKIAGSGPAKKVLQDLAHELSVKAEFLGDVRGEELHNLIARAKAVIIPSIWQENMPLNLLESLAAGQIVIASDIGGIPEIIQDGKNGLLFQPGQAPDLAAKIKSVATVNRLSISQAAQATVKDFNVVKHTSQIEEIYRTTINKHASLIKNRVSSKNH